MKASHTVTPVFDDPNLVSAAGLVPVMRLAETAGLHELLDRHLSVDSPNPAVKSASIVAGLLAGADSIDDLDLLRHGAMEKVFGGVRAPSTLGTYLRSFTHGHVQQVDAVAARLLAGLTARVPGLLAGADQMMFVDVDDTIREVHGYSKQAAAFGYSGVRGLNAQLAAVSTPAMAPVIAAARLRRGNTASHTGCGRLLTQAIGTARTAGASGQILARVRRRRPEGRGLVLGDRADEPADQGRDHLDRRGRMGSDRVSRRRLGRGRTEVGVRRRGRRNRGHDLHLPPHA